MLDPYYRTFQGFQVYTHLDLGSPSIMSLIHLNGNLSLFCYTGRGHYGSDPHLSSDCIDDTVFLEVDSLVSHGCQVWLTWIRCDVVRNFEITNGLARI